MDTFVTAEKKRFLIVGSGGREAAFALGLFRDVQLYAVIGHENPLIVDCVAKSGGSYVVGDVNDPQTVLNFAQEHLIDLAFVNADQSLANGVVDALLAGGFKAVGGIKDAARIEWDKIYSIRLMDKVCPEFTPFYRIVSDSAGLSSALSEFESRGLDVVVKPQGLTGGKGVKVMPEHLASYSDCSDYASSLLENGLGEDVLLVERLDGIEFTIMGITDGLHLAVSPASYDYPYRLEGDRGPGTGGMGCFTDCKNKLPFMTDHDLDACRTIMQRVIDDMRSRGLRFSGVLNGGFFKTRDGIKFMEFNSRFGDPEGLNILSVLETPFSELLMRMWDKTISDDIVFAKKASVIIYLVAAEYPDASPNRVDFEIDEEAVKDLGVTIYFASCVRTGSCRYETLKKSRVVAMGAISDTIEDASLLVREAIRRHVRGALEYRRDIGSIESLKELERRVSSL